MSNIFDTEYFPTPREVISQMIAPYRKEISKRQILEPSAGTGSILDYLAESYGYKAPKANLYACEINPELVMVLQGKGYKILADDFLSYKPSHTFDLIVMNPPFSNGDEHLLHAWDILWTGDVVCLLNAETIRNPYTQRRKDDPMGSTFGISVAGEWEDRCYGFEVDKVNATQTYFQYLGTWKT